MSTATTDEEVQAPEQGRSRRRYDPSWDDWKAPRRWPGVLLTCVIVLGFIGVVAWHYRPHDKIHHASTSFPPAASIKTAYVMAANGQGATIRTFHGTHNAQNLKFTTDGKLLVLYAACECSYNFVVTVKNAVQTPVAFPITATGPFNTSINLQLPAGEYSLQVVAPSPASWRVLLIQPGPSITPIPIPKRGFKFYSNTPSVIGPFSSSNRFLFFRFLSESNAYARVYVLDPSGNRVDTAFSGRTEIYRGTTLPDPSNPFYVEVDAGAVWQIRVQHSSSG